MVAAAAPDVLGHVQVGVETELVLSRDAVDQAEAHADVLRDLGPDYGLLELANDVTHADT